MTNFEKKQQPEEIKYFDQVNKWRESMVKENLQNTSYGLFLIGSVLILLIGFYYRNYIIYLFDFHLVGELVYYNLIAIGIYVFLSVDFIKEMKQINVISGVILPVAIFLEIIMFVIGLDIFPFVIFIAIGLYYYSILDVLRGRIILKKSTDHPDKSKVYQTTDTIKAYKRILILERWNSNGFKLIFILSFILLLFGTLGFEDIKAFLGNTSFGTFVSLNMISFGFVLITGELALAEFKERDYISSIAALLFCETCFTLYALGKIVISHEETVFFVLIFVALVMISPLDMLLSKIK